MKKVIYSDEIKYFALGKRREGLGWGEIRRAMKEKFKVGPLPTIRAMQRWEQALSYDELGESVSQKLNMEAEESKGMGLTKMAEAQLRNLWGSRLLGEQIEYEGWRYFLSLLENILGSEKFRKYMGKYQSERAGQPDLPPALLE